MVKSRVHDLAAEFGVPVEQLMGMLREMNIFVRSHMSSLEPDQVSAVRVRWEREKRKAAEAPAPKKGRRKVVAAAPQAPVAEAKPVRRRRTAAEVAEQEAKAAVDAEEEASASFEIAPVRELDKPAAEAKSGLSLEERAKRLFKDLPPEAEAAIADATPDAPAAEVPAATEPEAPTAPPAPPVERPVVPSRPSIPPRPSGPTIRPASTGDPTTAPSGPGAPKKPFIPPRVQRPTPAASGQGGRPTGPARGGSGGRPRPVFSSSTPAPGRSGSGPVTPGAPVARTFGPDAQPGGGRKKGKKGKKSFVDQDQVQANILKTLHGMKGTAGPRKKSRSDEPSYRDIIASRAAEEKEREKTRIRVNEFISVSELADAMKIPANQIVLFAFKELGLMVTVNQRLDFDQIE
ncbi:MAG: translation initiation factor IF-2 N-terminal domain-containing protein, partial [Gemmatimonadota bacterium]